MYISQAVALRLLELLQSKGISQYKLCKDSTIPTQTIISIMKTKAKSVDLKTIILISNALGMTLSEFFDSNYFEYSNIEIL